MVMKDTTPDIASFNGKRNAVGWKMWLLQNDENEAPGHLDTWTPGRGFSYMLFIYLPSSGV